MITDINAIQDAARFAWDTFYNETDGRTVSYRGKGKILEDCKYQATFQAVARYCIAHRYDVRDYILTCLDFLLVSNAMVLPTDLLRPPVQSNYVKVLSDRHEVSGDVALWQYQCRFVARQQIERPDLFTDLVALLYPAIRPFTAWFRIFYPTRPILKLVDEYGSEGWWELNKSPSLRRLLRKERPETMKLVEDTYGGFFDEEEEPDRNAE